MSTSQMSTFTVGILAVDKIKKHLMGLTQANMLNNIDYPFFFFLINILNKNGQISAYADILCCIKDSEIVLWFDA